MFADPLKLIPLIVLAVVRVAALVAVAEFPLQAEAVAEFPVQDPDDPEQFPVTLPVTPPLAVISPLAATVVKLAADAEILPTT